LGWKFNYEEKSAREFKKLEFILHLIYNRKLTDRLFVYRGIAVNQNIKIYVKFNYAPEQN